MAKVVNRLVARPDDPQLYPGDVVIVRDSFSESVGIVVWHPDKDNKLFVTFPDDGTHIDCDGFPEGTHLSDTDLADCEVTYYPAGSVQITFEEVRRGDNK